MEATGLPCNRPSNVPAHTYRHNVYYVLTKCRAQKFSPAIYGCSCYWNEISSVSLRMYIHVYTHMYTHMHLFFYFSCLFFFVIWNQKRLASFKSLLCYSLALGWWVLFFTSHFSSVKCGQYAFLEGVLRGMIDIRCVVRTQQHLREACRNADSQVPLQNCNQNLHFIEFAFIKIPR